MELWLDTADIEEIREINAWGILSGITTNPTLVGREKVPFHQRLKEIAEEVDGPVNGEVISTVRDEMVSEGEVLAKIAPNIVVKLPMTPDGLSAVVALGAKGIRTNMTLCFSPAQAILAARAGATYISPFLGRVDDAGNDGIALLAEITEVYRVQGYDTKVLAASLRSPQHVVDSAKVGADVATMPASVFRSLVNHPLTEIGLRRFLEDWETYRGSVPDA